MSETSIDNSQIKSTLIDITNCIGCRACQVACKHWNDRDGEETEFLGEGFGFQNPATLSAKTYTLISTHERVEESAPGGVEADYVMRRCLHCIEPACVSACPTTALERLPTGPVIYEASQCIGCRYCIWACPWDVPTADWDTLTPKIHKCTHCADRTGQPVPQTRNGEALTDTESQGFLDTVIVPACVKACPADALRYGTREEMLTEARRRITTREGRYIDHIYGEHEAGGTTVLYLSRVPFEKLGFPKVGNKAYPAYTSFALKAVTPAVMALGTFLGLTTAFFKRRAAVAEAEGAAAPHVEFEKLDRRLSTPFNWTLLAVMLIGGLAFVLRFTRGLGGSTNLSDTYPWGLWIIFDLVWIAIAAGAFATAGIIYVLQRKDLYAFGRSAVFLGLLSYTFVSVTLLADLGAPWNSYHLAIQKPDHSAMFEVSWCVGLYVSVLLWEFLPVVFESRGWTRAMELWQRYCGVYVVFAATLFVFLLSRNPLYAAATAVFFGLVAWAFRPKEEHFEPIILAIAAVTLSTMHQSSLGSLFLIMPETIARQWWSPVMPISFFLSSVVAGTAAVVMVAMWIAKGWNRPLRMAQMASMAQFTFWSLAVYLAFRLGDMAVRGNFEGAFTGRLGAVFLAEIVLLGVLPLVLLSRAAWRANPKVLFWGAALAAAGVVLNRVSVVTVAMNPQGPMPRTAPSAYSPSIVEWGISIGLIAATIYLYGVGARRLPLLAKRDAAH